MIALWYVNITNKLKADIFIYKWLYINLNLNKQIAISSEIIDIITSLILKIVLPNDFSGASIFVFVMQIPQ